MHEVADAESSSAQAQAGQAARVAGGRTRWGIAALLGTGILINYFDRVNISVAGTDLQHAMGLSAGQLGILFSAFTWSYGLAQIPVGLLLDRIGVAWVTRVSTVLWACATFLTAVVSGLGMILLARLLLGLAEAPAIVSSQKTTSYWFPRQERGLCTSAFDGAAKFSNVIGVPLMSVVVSEFGWRGAFWVSGSLSLLYALAYWLLYRNPRQMLRAGRLSQSEYRYITEGGAQDEDAVPANQFAGLGRLLRNRKVWGLSLGFACYNYAFFMLLTWLPGYLEGQLHMSVLKGGLYSAIPWITATLSDLLIGGLLVDRLIARGRDANRVRKSVLVGGMVVGLCVIGGATTHTPAVAVLFISLGLGGLSASAPVGSSCVALIAPEGSVGAVGGILNFLSQLFVAAAPIVTGYLVDDTGNFAWGFVIATLMVALGILCYLFVLGRIEQVPSLQPAQKGTTA
ncbi:MFS transporter [Streptacidiphilus sp. NEAU-YB345]|uniref:MFS transporter n=1 Tax=Streptacidiphilus fuscans TaxID=2789292 RepID=A0A931AWT7_9ACTN|nr:MFS transporter [Streptacidiphilus fuscans]